MTYFCECFVCGSADECSHREFELVVWWRSATRQPSEAARVAAVAAPVQIARPSEVATVPVVQIEAPEPAPRKPVSRAEALRTSQYSAVRGW